MATTALHGASRIKHLVHYNIYNSTFVGNPIANSIWKRIFVLRLWFCFWQLALLRSVNITFDDRYMRRHLKRYTMIIIILCLIWWLLYGYESFPVFTFSFFFSLVFDFQQKKKNVRRSIYANTHIMALKTSPPPNSPIIDTRG